MNSRAIHLELLNDMSTDSFILSLRRFIARRGHVKTIRSDNGTHFVGASRELQNAFKKLNKSYIVNFLTTKSISWKFNPPASSWIGSSWEAPVKSVKTSLKVITND